MHNNSIYKTAKFEARGFVFSVLYVSGKFNYVSVKKETANPFGVGREFVNFDVAINSYKSKEMKSELTKLKNLFLYLIEN